MNRYELSEFVLTLIDKANTHTPLRFQQSMIDLVRDVIVFDAAWWGWSLFRGGKISIVHTNLSGLPPEFEFAVRDRLVIDPFIRTARSLKLFTRSLSVNESVTDPRFRELSDQFNLTQMLNGHCNAREGRFNFFMSLYRFGKSPAFTETENSDYLAILRHLEQALSLSLRFDLSLRVEPHSEWALLDHEGELFLGSTGFEPLLTQMLPRGQRVTTRLKELAQRPSFTGQDGTVFERARYSDDLWIITALPRSPWKLLSNKEQQVAVLLISGATARQIADHLQTSVNTVRNQTTSIYRKMGVRNKVELSRAASRLKVPDS